MRGEERQSRGKRCGERKMIEEREEEGRGWRRGQRCEKEEGRDQRTKWKLGGLHNAAGVSDLSQWDLTP